MPTKSIFSSKTFWLNVALAAAGFVLDHQGLLAQIPAEYQTLIIAVANIVVRFKTQQPVSVL